MINPYPVPDKRYTAWQEGHRLFPAFTPYIVGSIEDIAWREGRDDTIKIFTEALANEPKVVHSSHLALRFYKIHGWTLELLNACCSHGSCYCLHTADASPYFTLDNNRYSKFDTDKLIKQISIIYDYDNLPVTNPRAYLEMMAD